MCSIRVNINDYIDEDKLLRVMEQMKFYNTVMIYKPEEDCVLIQEFNNSIKQDNSVNSNLLLFNDNKLHTLQSNISSLDIKNYNDSDYLIFKKSKEDYCTLQMSDIVDILPLMKDDSLLDV